MEPSLIYKVSDSLLSKVTWEHSDNYGWIFCGTKEDFQEDLLRGHIISHFGERDLYIRINRKDSMRIPANKAVAVVKRHIESMDVALWSLDFKKVIEINKIGVFRKGTCTANIGLPK